MKMIRPGTFALLLTVALWGILLGGILYSNLVYIPVFLGDLPESSVVASGKYGLNEGLFWMGIHPLLVISLIISLALNWRARHRRNLIVFSAAVYLGALIATSIYFLPELRAFSQSLGSGIPQSEWVTRGSRWRLFSWVRGAVLIAAYFPLLFALVTADERPA